MAKKKTVNPEETAQVLENSVETVTTEETATTAPETIEDATEIVPAKKKPEAEHVQEIPAHADHLLKIFSNYEELYIDDKGSVFTKGTQPNLVEGAILYQNPYYNK